MKIAIVGAGLYGATVAALLSKEHVVHVYEKSNIVGGNVADYYDERIQSWVPKHGAHIFHTNSDTVWNFVNQFGEFSSYQHYVKGRLPTRSTPYVDLPFGMSMFSQLLGLRTPEAAKEHFEDLRRSAVFRQSETIEEWCLSNIGEVLYTQVVKNYTEKQWGRPCSELPSEIIKRLPMRFTYDTTYFNNAKYQGMPKNGYSGIIGDMLSKSRMFLGWSVGFNEMAELMSDYDLVFYSGPLDRLFEYRAGVLPYRGLKFVDDLQPCEYHLGVPVLNDLTTANHTRRIEHKLFNTSARRTESTLITTEYPQAWEPGMTPYYPIRNADSSNLHDEYQTIASREFPRMVVGGRLGAYRYYDMDQVIGMALADVNAGTVNGRIK